jgi:UDP-N-acetylmuramyl pentapeptide phosphotransferase/UDP-N-acetylglucosamine-1-phosphate transferase
VNASSNQLAIKLLVAIGITIILVILMLQVKWAKRFCRQNAFGDLIPVTYGVIPAIALMMIMLVAHPEQLAACLLVLGFCIVGLLDDLYGSAAFRGIKGHLSALRQGIITTGLIKLVASPIMATLFAVSAYGIQNWLTYVYITMIAASSNAFNLLDLRPGRSQGFAIILLLGILTVFHAPIVIGAILVLLITIIPDARAKVMMGDSGAIAIGAGIALIVIASSNIIVSVAYTILVVGLNLIAEKYSLGSLIAQGVVLRKIDSLLGRRA